MRRLTQKSLRMGEKFNYQGVPYRVVGFPDSKTVRGILTKPGASQERGVEVRISQISK